MSDSDLEEELRALRPARPLPGLEEAIARELVPQRPIALRPASGVLTRPSARPRFSWWPSLGWAVAGTFALVALLLLPFSGTKEITAVAQTSSLVFEPVDSQPEILSAANDEVSYDNEQGPTQLVRYSSIERQTWANLETGAQLEVEMPREDVFLIPVSYQ
jgi:hypothetical protein